MEWSFIFGMVTGAVILLFGVLFGAAIVVGSRPKDTEETEAL